MWEEVKPKFMIEKFWNRWLNVGPHVALLIKSISMKIMFGNWWLYAGTRVALLIKYKNSWKKSLGTGGSMQELM
jgi:hypothetical protein